MRRWFWLLSSLLILGVWPLLAQTPGGAHWRLGHFAIDVSDVDVYVDNALVFQQIKLAAVNGWRDLPGGAHTISITPAGGTLDRPLLQPFTLNAQAGQWVTLALAGRRTDGSLKLHAVVEDMRPLANGLTRLSVFNAFPNNPPLTIRLDETEIIRLLAYPGTREGNDGMESRDVIAGSHTVTIELADGQLVKELPGVGLGAGRAYLLVIFGTLDRPFPLLVATDIGSGAPVVPTQGSIPVIVPTATAAANTPVFVVPTATLAVPAATAAETDTQTDDEQPEPTVTLALPAAAGGEANVRFGHFAPGSPAITFYLDTQAVAQLSTDGLVMTEYRAMPSGQHTLSLVLEGETLDQAFLRQTVSFTSGRIYLVAAIGSLDIGSFNVVTAEENVFPKPGEAQIGLFNAVPDVKELALFREGISKPIFKELAFPLAYLGAGNGYAVAGVVPGNYNLIVSEDNEDETFTELNRLPELHLGEGRYYTLIITGLKDQPGQPYLIFSSYPPSKPVPPFTATPAGQ